MRTNLVSTTTSLLHSLTGARCVISRALLQSGVTPGCQCHPILAVLCWPIGLHALRVLCYGDLEPICLHAIFTIMSFERPRETVRLRRHKAGKGCASWLLLAYSSKASRCALPLSGGNPRSTVRFGPSPWLRRSNPGQQSAWIMHTEASTPAVYSNGHIQTS